MINPVTVIDLNYVVVCGVTIHRPGGIAPSQWLDYWQRAITTSHQEEIS